MEKLINAIKCETGMDILCCICLEWKSKSSCVPISHVNRDLIDKYIIETELAQNSDGAFYLCNQCKTSVLKNQEPIRSQKEFIGLLDFPKTFKDKLHEICADTRSSTDLNKMEDHLIKLVIPFIRIGHLPRGPYLKVIGDLIMIASNVTDTMSKILPLQQEFIPVSLKRRMNYKGHFLEEFIEKNKVLSYFEFFKKYNHLYKDKDFDEKILKEIEEAVLDK